MGWRPLYRRTPVDRSRTRAHRHLSIRLRAACVHPSQQGGRDACVPGMHGRNTAENARREKSGNALACSHLGLCFLCVEGRNRSVHQSECWIAMEEAGSAAPNSRCCPVSFLSAFICTSILGSMHMSCSVKCLFGTPIRSLLIQSGKCSYSFTSTGVWLLDIECPKDAQQ